MRRTVIALGASLVTLVVIMSAGAATHKGVRRPATYVGRVGFHVHFAAKAPAEAEQGMRALKAIGVTWVRDDFDWRYAEPRPGQFDFGRGDTLMTAAARTRMNVLGILAYAPRWAATDSSEPYSPPKNLSDYATYIKYVLWRYGPGGDFWRQHPNLEPMPLRAVELWNEPWAWWFWRPGPDPAAYARLAHAGAAAVRSVAPETTILISGDVWGYDRNGSGPPFLAAVLTADPKLRKLVDGYSVHAYTGAQPPSSRRSALRFQFDRIPLTKQVARRFHAGKPIWLTEYGWSTAPSTPRAVTEAQQARYIVGATKIALKRYNVAKAFVYDYSRSNGRQGDLENNYGMIRSDGSYKPAWDAVVRLLRAQR
jgi:hypothetical protein